MILATDGVIQGAGALAALWNGAFGSWYAFLSATLVRATPLLLLGLAVALAFRAGVLNIGAEGQFLAGAVGATLVALHSAGLPGFVVFAAMLAAGAVGGALWSGVAAILRWRFGVLEVISTLLLNFVASSLVSWLVRGPLQEPTGVYPQTRPFAPEAHWPFLVAGYRLHVGFAVGVTAALGLWWIVSHSAAGLRLRATGAGASAAASAGLIDVERTVFGVFLASGALAGAAGASEVGGVTFALYDGLSPGYGYTAIAVALLARLDARWVILSAVLFGALQAGSAEMQRTAGIPSAVVNVVVALIVLALLGVQTVRRSRTGSHVVDGAP